MNFMITTIDDDAIPAGYPCFNDLSDQKVAQIMEEIKQAELHYITLEYGLPCLLMEINGVKLSFPRVSGPLSTHIWPELANQPTQYPHLRQEIADRLDIRLQNLGQVNYEE